MGTPEPLPETGVLANQRPRKCDMTFVLTPQIPSSRWFVVEPEKLGLKQNLRVMRENFDNERIRAGRFIY